MKNIFVYTFILFAISGCGVRFDETTLAGGIINDLIEDKDVIKIELTGNQDQAEISYFEIDSETEESLNNEQLYELTKQKLESYKENIFLPYTKERALGLEDKLIIQIRLLSKKGIITLKIWKNNKLHRERKINYFNSPYKTTVD